MKLKVNNFNLHDTVTCGQIFRFYEEDDNSYTIILNDRIINVKMDKNELIIDSNNMDNIENIVRNYFDLDYDYEKLNSEIISIDSSNKYLVESCNGLKMINEPRFELIISYILSANNGVPQIRNSLNMIAKKYGEKVLFRDKEYYLFPSVDKLKNVSIDEYRECKAGFRDKYIYEIVSKINNKEFDIDSIETMNSDDALIYLMNNKGIGEKVASCILLFGYHRFDVFPIDTWVKKYMIEKYNLEKVKDIREYMKGKYNDNCGLVIQYIFHYNRNKSDKNE